MSQSDRPELSRIPTTRGRPFARGNPGRKPGSKNRSTALAAALLEDEREALVRKAIDLAHNGDVVMLKFLLSRVLPRERTVTLDLPRMDFADDNVEALACVMQAVSAGALTPSEGVQFATIVKSSADAIDLADAVKRLDTLEAKLRERGAI